MKLLTVKSLNSRKGRWPGIFRSLLLSSKTISLSTHIARANFFSQYRVQVKRHFIIWSYFIDCKGPADDASSMVMFSTGQTYTFLFLPCSFQKLQILHSSHLMWKEGSDNKPNTKTASFDLPFFRPGDFRQRSFYLSRRLSNSSSI